MNRFENLVKRQIQYFQSQIARHPPSHPDFDQYKLEKYGRLLRDFQDLLHFLESLPDGSQTAATAPDAVAKTPVAESVPPPSRIEGVDAKGDLSGLPAELLKQLSRGFTEAETDPVLKIINERGGTATLDEILIDLYRKHGEIAKRNVTSAKLYRLGKRELVWSSKGTYTTKRPEDGTDDGTVIYFEEKR